MKKFKKIFAALAASALVAAMSFTSMAASITITRGDHYETDGTVVDDSKKESYTYYKVLSAIKTSGDLGNTTDDNVGKTEEIKGVSYQIKKTDPWFNVLNDNDNVKEYLKLTQSADKSVYVVEWNDSKENNETNAINLANLLKSHLNDPKIKGTGETFKTGETKTVTDGYYLITSSLGTNLILATSDITIKEKNVYPTIDKFVDVLDNHQANHNIGDKVTYIIKVTVPENVVTDNEHQIVINDTMAKGFLKFKDDVTAVDSTNSAFNAFETTKISDNEFKITLKNLSEAKGKTITFTYTAELLAAAAANTEYANEATLSYSNYVTPKKIANVKTYDFNLKKTQETIDGAVLGGAQFELREDVTDPTTAIIFYKDGNNYVKADSIKITEDESLEENKKKCSKIITAGEVNVRGLKNGTYHLVETEAPAGYNILENEVAITIGDDGTITAANVDGKTVTVVNKKGILLPSTGGMGTVAFAVVGLIVMAGAAVTLIIKKRA